MPTVSGFSKPVRGWRLISVFTPVIFKSTKGFRSIDKRLVQGLRLID